MNILSRPDSGDFLHIMLLDCEDPLSMRTRLERVLEACRATRARKLILESATQHCALTCMSHLEPCDFGGRLFETGVTHAATVCENGTFALAGLLPAFRAAGGEHRGSFNASTARAWLDAV